MNFKNLRLIHLAYFVAFFVSCTKEPNDGNWTVCDYTGSYKNITLSENLVKEFSPGIYEEKDIPDDIKQLEFGRIEIDFRYNGGALNYFAPMFYYGSINKNNNDDAVEEPKFHLAIEIGHYNVIPLPVEYLFYTISTYRQPQYCRDTDWPIISGIDYTLVINKRPEGIILQLKKGTALANIFPHAFFPDSSQLFFKDVSAYIDKNRGDSLQKVLMVGKGFAGIEKGLHDFNGQISSLRIYKYNLATTESEYELQRVRNQHTENQQITYSLKDNSLGNDKYVVLKYEFLPYKFESGELIPNGSQQTGESEKTLNNDQLLTYRTSLKDVGFYKLYPETVDKNGNLLGTSAQPFEVWVYPKEWDFEFYNR